MAPPEIINIDDEDEDTSAKGVLFRNIRFWVAQRTPIRSTYVEAIQKNGGQIVPLEKNADILIADHMRKDCPAGSCSYTWIEQSIAHGALQDKEAHRAGPATGSVRAVASQRPAKMSRQPYTAGDDRILYHWVAKQEANGAQVKGNEIYKDLEQFNNRHPWQSWRDRWIKYVSSMPASTFGEAPQFPAFDDDAGEPSQSEAPKSPLRRVKAIPRSGGGAVGAPKQRIPSTTHCQISPISDAPSLPRVARVKNTSLNPRQQTPVSFTDDNAFKASSVSRPRQGQRYRSTMSPPVLRNPVTDEEHDICYKLLLDHADDIQDVVVGKYDDAWEKWAIEHPEHTALEWRDFYEINVLPDYKEHEAKNETMHGGSRDAADSADLGTVRKARAGGDSVLAASMQARQPRQALEERANTPDHGNASKTAETGHDPSSDMTPSRRTVPIVIVPSPSPQQKANVDSSQLLSENDNGTPESESRKRKRAPLRGISQSAAVESGRDSNKKQRVEDVVVEEIKQASRVLASALDTRRLAQPIRKEVEFIDLVNVEDDGAGFVVLEDHVVKEEDGARVEKTPFQIYESHEVPEGDEENAVITGTGSPGLPVHHSHVKSEQALEVFGDPPAYFKLFVPESDPQDPEEGWHDLELLEAEAGEDFAKQLRAGSTVHGTGPLETDTTGIEVEEQNIIKPLVDAEVLDEQGSLGESLEDEELEEDDPNSLFIPTGESETTSQNYKRWPYAESGQSQFSQPGTGPSPQIRESSATVAHPDAQALDEFRATAAALARQNAPSDLEAEDERENYGDNELEDDEEDEEEEEDDDDGRARGEEPENSRQPSRQRQTDTQAILDSDGGMFIDLDVPSPQDSEDEEEDDIVNVRLPPVGFVDTQAILEAETQRLDLDDPLPHLSIEGSEDEPFDLPLSEAEERPLPVAFTSDDDVDASSRYKPQGAAVYDFPSSPPTGHSSPPPTTTASKAITQPALTSIAEPNADESEDPMDAFLAHHCDLGSSEQDVLYALFCTSWNSRLATQVLESMRQGLGVPVNVPGIWTEEEDAVVRGGDGGQMRRLEMRHGKKAYAERVVALEEYMGF